MGANLGYKQFGRGDTIDLVLNIACATMRRHVAISGLLAYLIGLSVGDRAEDVSLGQHDEGTAIGSTPVVSISYKNSHTFEIALSSSSTFSFDTTSDVELGTVRLKIYSENGLDDGQDIIASTTLPSATAPTDADGLSAGSSQGIAPNNDLFKRKILSRAVRLSGHTNILLKPVLHPTLLLLYGAGTLPPLRRFPLTT